MASTVSIASLLGWLQGDIGKMNNVLTRVLRNIPYPSRGSRHALATGCQELILTFATSIGHSEGFAGYEISFSVARGLRL